LATVVFYTKTATCDARALVVRGQDVQSPSLAQTRTQGRGHAKSRLAEEVMPYFGGIHHGSGRKRPFVVTRAGTLVSTIIRDFGTRRV